MTDDSAMDIVEEVSCTAVVDELAQQYNDLEDQIAVSSDCAVEGYKSIIQNSRMDDDAVKIKEKCIYGLARTYTSMSRFNEVMGLLHYSNTFFSAIPKAKTAKIVRNIIDILSTIPNSIDVQIRLCRDVIAWCKEEKRTFLRQRVESKLAGLLLQQKHGQEAMTLIAGLLRELKKLDDKQMLTEVHLLESRVNHSLQNIPKAKAALTAARTAANSIYVTPLLQAELDEMSGTLYCEENDNVTGYSYFLEAFEAYDSCKDPRAVHSLKYMCLCKILGGHPSEVPTILSGKHGLKYSGSNNADLEAMTAVADAAKKRSLEDFEETVVKYSALLKSDDLISHHLDLLYDQMLESNLLKIIHPFSCVEISHVAKLIKMDVALIERKLSQMILDRTISGILEQGKGHLVIYDAAHEDTSFTQGVEIISNMGLVVDALSSRAKGLSTKTLEENKRVEASDAKGDDSQVKPESPAKDTTKK
eukprot:CAMPEP_0185040226 /NCGR_PEP_ID=MMETSP1103-20130426/38029_1 /TAXON_ID=36769 /ORGANISM="Paraphysomonas bandaiensis, Strain Caron Lab Isolate" /LENGTH=473 /DNA_ID=CAMNT_0027579435 /DNA_START=20 /DNA_END=1441 /DNA_ORIENTATION=-